MTILTTERVAYWYFRLNGFFQIENFIVHSSGSSGQRTDADLLAVRFPYRKELDRDSDCPMQDDRTTLQLEPSKIQIMIVEVKTNQPCTLNGPWSASEKENVQRVLDAIGCLEDDVELAADAIYKRGSYSDDKLSIRLVAVGRDLNGELASRFENVIQLTWNHVLEFIWERFTKFERQKTDIEQWDEVGKELHTLSKQSGSNQEFSKGVLFKLGIDTV